jgi:hypothetical protein
MARFLVSGQSIELPAIRVARGPTQCERAWMFGQYVTVRLISAVDGIRVHTNGRSFTGRVASGAQGAWVAIGDIIQPSEEFVGARALPGLFTHIAWTLIPEQCVINVGMSGPLFGAPGGGFQAEYVAGPAMTFNQAVGNTGTTALETRSRRNL